MAVEPLLPSNCGFEVANGWSQQFSTRFVGQPVKPVVATATDMRGRVHSRRGEFMVSEYGVEGSLVYALSALLRDSIRATGEAQLTLDLAPDWSPERLSAALAHPRGSRSLSSHLQSRAGMTGVRAGLLRELLSADQMQNALKLAQLIKYLPVILKVIHPIYEAISSAGGVSFKAIDVNQMLRSVSGVFCAGEMLDWEAPTGGYLLSACFASGHAAGKGAALWLAGT